MTTNWTLYEKRLKINGNTEKERHINTVVNSINNDFSHSPSFQEVKINGVTTGVHILEDGNKADNVKNIVMKPSDILSIGNIIEWDGIKWLCTSVELYSGIYYYGKIQKCVYSLTINKNGISSEVPIVIESAVRLYSLGQDSTKYTNTLSDDIIVYTPASANIEVDDVYKIGRRNYKVMTVQDVLIDGLLVVKMEVTVEEPIIEKHEYSILILEGEEITLYGGESSTLQLNVQCKLDGVLVSNPKITYSSSDIECCTIDENGLVTIEGTGSSTITATYGDSSDTIIIKSLLNVVDNYEIMITPLDTTIDVYETKTFTANVKNNGVDMPYHGITWIVDNAYCTHTINGRNVTITAKNNINKQIKIKAVLDIDSTKFKEQILTIKSLV